MTIRANEAIAALRPRGVAQEQGDEVDADILPSEAYFNDQVTRSILCLCRRRMLVGHARCTPRHAIDYRHLMGTAYADVTFETSCSGGWS